MPFLYDSGQLVVLFNHWFRGFMAPTVFREGSFRFFFFSREEPRKHIHVSHTDGEAKFWLKPELELAMNQGLSPKQISEALASVRLHYQEVLHAWNRHFGD